MKHIVIIGGGISGLATAFYAHRLAHERDLAIHCTVLEAGSQLGGKLKTERVGEYLVEGGPESFVTRKPAAYALCCELGLRERLLGTSDAGKNYVLHNGQPVQVPTSPPGFLRTPLLSWRGKLRAAQELFVSAKPGALDADEPLGQLIQRRFGAEVLDNLVAPAIGSIYLSDVNQLSTQVSFQRFAAMERQHGSVLRGMMAAQKLARQSNPQQTDKSPQFVTLPNGMGELIDTLVQNLREMDCDIRTDAHVARIEPNCVCLANDDVLKADAIVLAIPAFAMADLLSPYGEDLARALNAVPYINVATITLAYARTQLRQSFDGFGIVVPAREQSPLIALEAISNKWPGRAPQTHVLVRAFVGGHRNPQVVAQSDEALVKLAHAEIAHMFVVQGEPAFQRVVRWQPGNPQYPVGHLEALTQLEAKLSAVLPQVLLTGAGLRGLGVPDCVRQAKEAASRAISNAPSRPHKRC